jgi:uncharacterized membrane protein
MMCRRRFAAAEELTLLPGPPNLVMEETGRNCSRLRLSHQQEQANTGEDMSNLVVIGFDKIETADLVLLRLRKLKREYLIDLEDAVVVERDASGEVHLKQSINLTRLGASSGLLSGSLLGALVGMMFLNPVAGFLIGGVFGAGGGALSGSLTDYGIDDDFIRSLGETIPTNSSALFILVRNAQPERVLAELSDVKGKVLRTSLSPQQEQQLQKALSGETPAVQQKNAG